MEDWYIITGEINPVIAHQLINWVQEKRCNGLNKLTLYISSIGGDIDSAIRVYDYLKSISVEIKTVSFGQIDSAANLIFLAGKERESTHGCRFFLHEGTYNFGNPKSALHVHDETIRLFRNILDSVSLIISKETGNSIKTIKTILHKGKLLTVDEAEKLGIVTKIIDTIPALLTQTNSSTN